MRRIGRRALSLIEVILASTLTLLLLGTAISTLLPLMHYANWGSARAELVESVAGASRRLVEDLQCASLQGISLPTPAEPGLLSIHPIAGVTDTGVSVWDNQLVIYAWDSGTGCLTRKNWPPPASALPGKTITPDGPLLLLPGELRTVVSQPNGTERILIQGILTSFSLLPASPTSSLPLHLRLTVRLPVVDRGVESYVHDEDINLRNLGS